MAGLWEAVMVGVTSETPAQQNPVATAVVATHSDHGTNRRFMSSRSAPGRLAFRRLGRA
jgi:hypothetical protein